jgi:molybdate transport system regulatory protein
MPIGLSMLDFYGMIPSAGRRYNNCPWEASNFWADAGMRQAPRRRGRPAEAPSEATDEDVRHAALTIRVDFGEFGYIGPGKIALMELISKHGSISAAGKEMGMSYRRAWLLVDEVNQIFRAPLVEKQMGGSGGGGARLTKLGRDVVGRYRAIEGATATATAADLRALKASLPNRPASRKRSDL